MANSNSQTGSNSPIRYRVRRRLERLPSQDLNTTTIPKMPIRVRHEERWESDTDRVSTHNDTAAAPTPFSDEAKPDAIADATALETSLDTHHHQMKDGTAYSPTSGKTMTAQLRRELERSSDQKDWQPGFAAKRGRGHQRSRITLSTFVPAQLSLPNQK